MSKILKINEMDDFTKEIAKDLFNRLPKDNFSEEDFLNYMKEKGSPDSISKEVLSHLKSMRFPFKSERFSFALVSKKDDNSSDWSNVIDKPTEDDEDGKEYSSNPSDWYFAVHMSDNPKCIALTMDPDCLDDDLGSHNLPTQIKKLVKDCGVYTHCELQESIWEITGDMSEEDIIRTLQEKGFNYAPDLFD